MGKSQFNNQLHKFGEKGSGFRPRGEVQDFQKIRDRCLENGVLFEDPVFPAVKTSLYFSGCCPEGIEWKRPKEICDEPRLFVEGVSRFDVTQGILGDCWFIAAVANLTLNDALLYRVVPKDQSFEKDYAGVFHFRFWQYGRWVDIVVDDRLPTRGGQLYFMRSKQKNEFWSALLEKAYAKLHGSYEALIGGSAFDAMEDFTGGVTEIYKLNKAPPNLYKILLKAYERWSLISCSIDADPNVLEARMDNGLIRGHAYSITKVKLVQTPRVKGKIPLLRIRNPWGNECEWTGAWSDQSPEWTLLSPEEKESLGLRIDKDGEFWISYKDFLQNFHDVQICNLSPDSLDDEPLTKKSKKKWEASMFESSWVKNCSAGGCFNNRDTFWMNPQFRIELGDVDDDDDDYDYDYDDDDDDDDDGDNLCTVIIALMQKNSRCTEKRGRHCLSIGYSVYELNNPGSPPKPLPKTYFLYHPPKVRTEPFLTSREVSCRFHLPPGTYCIVPSTFNKNEEADFVIRVFTEKQNNMTEYDEDIGLTKPDDEVQIETEKEKSKDDEVKEFFTKIAGEDLEVDCYELKEILDFALKKEFKFDGFSLDVCRSMVAMMDADRSGKLGLEEFKNLFVDIRTWKNVFKKYDVDQSGSLNTIELRAALNSAGYRLNFHVLRVLVQRYGKKGKICFDDFIQCAVKLKTMIETFQERDPRRTLKATFTLDEWVEKTMYS